MGNVNKTGNAAWGSELRKIREASGLTVAEFKQKTGIHPSCFYPWETGRSGISASSYEKVVKAFPEVKNLEGAPVTNHNRKKVAAITSIPKVKTKSKTIKQAAKVSDIHKAAPADLLAPICKALTKTTVDDMKAVLKQALSSYLDSGAPAESIIDAFISG